MKKNKNRNSSKTLKKHSSQDYFPFQPYQTLPLHKASQNLDHIAEKEPEYEQQYQKVMESFDENIRVCYKSLSCQRKNVSIKRCLLMDLRLIKSKQRDCLKTKINPQKGEKLKPEAEKSQRREKTQTKIRDKNRKTIKPSKAKENAQKNFPEYSNKMRYDPIFSPQISFAKTSLPVSRSNSFYQITFGSKKNSKEYHLQKKQRMSKR